MLLKIWLFSMPTLAPTMTSLRWVRASITTGRKRKRCATPSRKPSRGCLPRCAPSFTGHARRRGGRQRFHAAHHQGAVRGRGGRGGAGGRELRDPRGGHRHARLAHADCGCVSSLAFSSNPRGHAAEQAEGCLHLLRNQHGGRAFCGLRITDTARHAVAQTPTGGRTHRSFCLAEPHGLALPTVGGGASRRRRPLRRPSRGWAEPGPGWVPCWVGIESKRLAQNAQGSSKIIGPTNII